MRLLRTICLAVLVTGCTEPQERDFFEGTITSRSDVTDVFQNTTTTHISVDKRPGALDVDVCRDRASVTVTAQTFIAWQSTPGKQESVDLLTGGRVVRVFPPTDPRDICPRMLDATSILLVK
jgi:hypothetical protein